MWDACNIQTLTFLLLQEKWNCFISIGSCMSESEKVASRSATASRSYSSFRKTLEMVCDDARKQKMAADISSKVTTDPQNAWLKGDRRRWKQTCQRSSLLISLWSFVTFDPSASFSSVTGAPPYSHESRRSSLDLSAFMNILSSVALLEAAAKKMQFAPKRLRPRPPTCLFLSNCLTLQIMSALVKVSVLWGEPEVCPV